MTAHERRPAAVLLTINATPPHGVIFVERGTHLRSHPGEIGLPGGGMDAADDGDLERTALRELHEELGIAATHVHVVWRLSSIRARINAYDVTPFVAVVEDVPLVVDTGELTGAFSVPLLDVVGGVHGGRVTFGSFEVETPVLEAEGRTIWGLTGAILREFVDEWNAPDGALRLRVERRLGGRRFDETFRRRD